MHSYMYRVSFSVDKQVLADTREGCVEKASACVNAEFAKSTYQRRARGAPACVPKQLTVEKVVLGNVTWRERELLCGERCSRISVSRVTHPCTHVTSLISDMQRG